MLAQICKLMGKDEATQKAAAFDELAHTLSQLLHGEQAALQLCGQLTNVCTKMDEKWYAASQVTDEARHSRRSRSSCRARWARSTRSTRRSRSCSTSCSQADTARKKTLGMQTLFEGMAVGIFDLLRQETPQPAAHRDDPARRAGRGAPRGLRRAHDAPRRARGRRQSEMDEMEDWAFGILEALNANQQLDMLQMLGPKYGIDAEQHHAGDARRCRTGPS